MIYYVRVQVCAVPINCEPFAKGAKASTRTRTATPTPTPSTSLTAALLHGVACHSRQQLSQLIGFRFISSIFPDPFPHTCCDLLCEEFEKKIKKKKQKKLFSHRPTRTGSVWEGVAFAYK